MSKTNFQLIYVLPNLFTASSAFIGVISMIAASKGEFEKAAWLIFLSLIFDGLDGRIARLTHTTSKFGVEFDSLADIIAFGAAPAMLLYFCCGHEYGRFGSLVSAMFVVFGAIRLARFNVMAPQSEPSVFVGVPIPTAAVFIAVWILMFQEYSVLKEYSVYIMISTLFVSLLMVSNIRYPSFKKVDLKKANVLKILILMIVAFSLLYLYPTEGIAILITVYLFYGPFRALFFVLLRKKRKI
ncbi:CDP-diacylglycerol--serine O-phosphatidyltransferase [Nitrosophilus alvini]|uniref:CDP-diacylglycerol--serine O-phosphatidyltransferase n=1 Tax=Nitrosophilus alvini TaxID=2714855 RepID=UPI00190C1F74|nr:CDP-diacylglycerol--serine O-phosphatidyltransferase [Nitrosophilus alvini]